MSSTPSHATTPLELAAFYNRLREKGRVHDQAVCAVANKLAGRAYAVMKRIAESGDAPYVYRDLEGRPIPKREASRRVKCEFSGPVAQRRQAAAREEPPPPPFGFCLCLDRRGRMTRG